MWFVQSTWETVILLCEVWFQCKIELKLFEELVWKVKIRFTFKEFMLHLNLELPLSPDCVCRVSHSDNNRRNKSHIPQQSRSNFILNPLQFYLFGIAHTEKSLISPSLCRILFQLRNTKNQLKTIEWHSRGLQSLAIVCTEFTEQFSIEMQNVAFAAAPFFNSKMVLPSIFVQKTKHIYITFDIYWLTIFPWYFRRAWNAKNMQIFRWWCCLVTNFYFGVQNNIFGWFPTIQNAFLLGFQQYKTLCSAVLRPMQPM